MEKKCPIDKEVISKWIVHKNPKIIKIKKYRTLWSIVLLYKKEINAIINGARQLIVADITPLIVVKAKYVNKKLKTLIKLALMMISFISNLTICPCFRYKIKHIAKKEKNNFKKTRNIGWKEL